MYRLYDCNALRFSCSQNCNCIFQFFGLPIVHMGMYSPTFPHLPIIDIGMYKLHSYNELWIRFDRPSKISIFPQGDVQFAFLLRTMCFLCVFQISTVFHWRRMNHFQIRISWSRGWRRVPARGGHYVWDFESHSIPCVCGSERGLSSWRISSSVMFSCFSVVSILHDVFTLVMTVNLSILTKSIIHFSGNPVISKNNDTIWWTNMVNVEQICQHLRLFCQISQCLTTYNKLWENITQFHKFLHIFTNS